MVCSVQGAATVGHDSEGPDVGSVVRVQAIDVPVLSQVTPDFLRWGQLARTARYAAEDFWANITENCRSRGENRTWYLPLSMRWIAASNMAPSTVFGAVATLRASVSVGSLARTPLIVLCSNLALEVEPVMRTPSSGANRRRDRNTQLIRSRD